MKFEIAIRKALEYLRSLPEKQAQRSKVSSRALKHRLDKETLDDLQDELVRLGVIDVITVLDIDDRIEIAIFLKRGKK